MPEEDEEGFTLLNIFKSTVIFHHDDHARVTWEWFVTILSVYSVISVPMVIAFPAVNTPAALELVFDLVFFVDLFICARTTYVDSEGTEITEAAKIRSHYLNGWFKVDFPAAMPLDIIFGGVVSKATFAHDILIINRLLRFARIVKKFDDFVDSNSGRIVFLMSMFLTIAHFMGSLFFWIGRSQELSVTGGRWIDGDIRLENEPFHFQYITSVYWALTTVGTVGYGDVTASSDLERFFTIICMFLGALIYAIIFGTLTTVIQNLDRSKNRYKEKVSVINDFVQSNELPAFIGQRLRAYLDASWNMRKRMAMSEVLDGVPEIVSAEIMMFMFSDLIRKVPIFATADRRFLERVVRCFRAQTYLEGDLLIREGDIGRELFFILKGSCDIVKFEGSGNDTLATVTPDQILKMSKYLAERGPGSFVGEAALLSGAPRGATVVCKTTELTAMYLLKGDFDAVVADFPDVLDHIMEISNARKKATAAPPNKNASGTKVSPRQSFSAQMASVSGSSRSAGNRSFKRKSRRSRKSIMKFGSSGRKVSGSFSEQMEAKMHATMNKETSYSMPGSGKGFRNGSHPSLFGSTSKASSATSGSDGTRSPSPHGKDAAFVMGKNADQSTGSQRPKSETACESEQVEPSPHPNNPRQAPVVIRRRSLSMDTGADLMQAAAMDTTSPLHESQSATEGESFLSEEASENCDAQLADITEAENED